MEGFKPRPFKQPDFVAMLFHILQYEIPRERREIDQNVFHNLRIKFLRGQINEQCWAKKIQKADNCQRRAQSIVDLLTLFVEGSIDILGRFHSWSEYLSCGRPEVEKLQDLCNRELRKLVLIHGLDSYHIGNEYLTTIHPTKETMMPSAKPQYERFSKVPQE